MKIQPWLIQIGRHAIRCTLPPLLLIGCQATTIGSSDNPSRSHPAAWKDYDTLPVVVKGSTPGKSETELASLFPTGTAVSTTEGRHIVLYVNPSQLPTPNELCSDPENFRGAAQVGDYANVTGAMCYGKAVATTASGTILTTNDSGKWIRRDLDTVRGQLYQSLYPGTNDPSKQQVN